MSHIDLNKFVRSSNKGMGLPLAAAPDMPELQARVARQQGNGVAMLYSGHDSYGLAFRFFIHDEKNEAKSKAAGCALYDPVECREVFVDKKTKVVQRVTDKMREQWPVEYAAFQERREAPGLPLSRWNEMQSNEILTLINAGIFTVEQFAMQAGDKIKKFPQFIRDYHLKAQQFVARQSNIPAVEQMADKFIALERENELMREQLAELMADKKSKGKAKKPKSSILPAQAGVDA